MQNNININTTTEEVLNAAIEAVEDSIVKLTMSLENAISIKFGGKLDEDDQLVKLYRAIGQIYAVEF